MMKKAISLLLALLMMLSVTAALADDSNSMKEDGFSTSYSYNYDYWRDVQISPDPYRVQTVIDTSSLGLENLENIRISKPEGIFCRNNDIYVADTANNRILQIEYKDLTYSLVRVIDEVKGAENNRFNNPYDVFVDAENNIYVADYSNHRIVMMDEDLNLILVKGAVPGGKNGIVRVRMA